MRWLFAGPKRLTVSLWVLTAIPVVFAMVRIVQIPTGTLPLDAIKYVATPAGLFLHAVGGVLFGILGPIQFAGVLAKRFGRLHRVLGRVFVVSGLLLGLSGFRLLWAFPLTSTPLLDWARLVAGLGLCLSLLTALAAARRRDIPTHKAWMIRAYAIGMGSAAVSFLLLPVFLITGEPVVGILSDLVFVASWVLNLSIAELVIRRGQRRVRTTALA